MEVGKFYLFIYFLFFYLFLFIYLFIYFLLFTFENDGNLSLGLPKWEFSTGKKHFTPGKESGKNDFAPSEKYTCYAHAYIHTRILLTLLTFLPSQFCKNCEFIMYGFSSVQLLVLILFRPILELSINNKMVSKI